MRVSVTTLLLFFALLPTGRSQHGVHVAQLFEMKYAPMQRLLLVNIENDPDSLYIGFEPQVFDDDVNGRGHLIIGWRTDGRVDVYHQPGLKLDSASYDIAGKGLAHMVEVEMKQASFEVTEPGVQASYAFNDLHNRQVKIRINENLKAKRKPFGLLAPMGDAVSNPTAMPLVLLHDFYFVRRKATLTEISIDNRQHTPDKLPMPMNRRRMFFTRYSTNPLILTFNPACQQQLPMLEAMPLSPVVSSGDSHYHLQWDQGKASVSSITFSNPVHDVEMIFDPPFPDVLSLPPDTMAVGSFTIQGHHSTGSIQGQYTIRKQNGELQLSLHPSGGWKPRPDRLSLRMMYRMAATFRKWPATYLWSARLYESQQGWMMESGWERLVE